MSLFLLIMNKINYKVCDFVFHLIIHLYSILITDVSLNLCLGTTSKDGRTTDSTTVRPGKTPSGHKDPTGICHECMSL